MRSTQPAVPSVLPVSLSVEPGAVSVAPSRRARVQVFAELRNGRRRDVTDAVTWTTDDAEIAHVDAEGKIVGGRSGTTIIRVKCVDAKAQISVTVK
jgi:hypothetical protein